MTRIKTALMGLSGAGGEMLRAVLADERFELRAGFDSDGEQLRRLRDEQGVAAYDDGRSLIVETARGGLDLVLVALPPHESAELLALAAKHSAAVFHRAPFARGVEEGLALCAAFEGAGRPLLVSRPWHFERAYAALREGGDWFAAASAEVRTPPGDRHGWRGDRARAGGGVLLCDAYEQVDLVTTLMGLPEQVSAQCAYSTKPGAARPYDTEDAAAVLMQFSGGRSGAIDAMRGPFALSWRATFVGPERAFELRGARMTVTPAVGKARSSLVRTKNRYAVELAAVAESLAGAVAPKPSTAADHLATLAVIEAAYLSAKTGAPESPSRMLP